MNVIDPSNPVWAVGDMVVVKRVGMTQVDISGGIPGEPGVYIPGGKTITLAGSDDNDIAVQFAGKITKISESREEIEELIITQSPEVTLDNHARQLRFNEQFKVGVLINADELESKKLKCTLFPEPKPYKP
jgi:hypothetical protein